MQNHQINSTGVAEWLPVLMISILLATYLYGVFILRRNGGKWSRFRIIAFISGIGLIIVAIAPPLANYAHHDLRGHMIQHLLIGMFAPLGLVLGAPLTLVYKNMPGSGSRKITSILRSRFFHFLSHPVSALLLNIGGMFLLYLTPLYAAMETNLWVHYIMQMHFLAAGYLFVWAIAGPDPAPKRPSLQLRLVILFISMATHAFLSKFMYAYYYPRNTSHGLKEIEDAAMLMYYGGDFAEVLLAIVFFSVWYKYKVRNSMVVPTVNL